MWLQSPNFSSWPFLLWTIVLVLALVQWSLGIPDADLPMLVAEENKILGDLRVISSGIDSVLGDLRAGDDPELLHPTSEVFEFGFFLCNLPLPFGVVHVVASVCGGSWIWLLQHCAETCLHFHNFFRFHQVFSKCFIVELMVSRTVGYACGFLGLQSFLCLYRFALPNFFLNPIMSLF
jgi:hypothetical protein